MESFSVNLDQTAPEMLAELLVLDWVQMGPTPDHFLHYLDERFRPNKQYLDLDFAKSLIISPGSWVLVCQNSLCQQSSGLSGNVVDVAQKQGQQDTLSDSLSCCVQVLSRK